MGGKEITRRLLIGKRVKWRQLYLSQSGDSTYVEMVTECNKAEHVGVRLIAAGAARVATTTTAKTNCAAFYAELGNAEAAARGAAVGIWGDGDFVRQVCAPTTEWFAEKKNVVVKGCIVEYIKDGNNFRLLVPDSENAKKFVSVNVSLSGVQNPGIRRGDKGKESEETAGQGSFYCRAFAVERLLSREIELRLESMTRATAVGATPTFIGSLLHPVKGSIAEFFLAEGFGLCVKWSASTSVSGLEKLEKAEKTAQLNKKGRWASGNANLLKDADKLKNFNGRVVEVVNGDQLKIVDTESPPGKRIEKRYYFSSVKAPTFAQEQQGAKPDGVWRAAGIEFLRKKLVGKTFRVKIDYKKNYAGIKAADGREIQGPAPTCEETKDVYYVTLHDLSPKDKQRENVLLDALEQGYLRLAQAYGGEDSLSQRSCDFSLLQDAEALAISGGKGLHGQIDPPRPENFTQLILGASSQQPRGRTPANKKELCDLAKAYESQLVQKKGGHEAIVTYVMNGSRIRVKLLHEKVLLTFQVVGIKCPNAAQRVDTSSATPEQRRLASQYPEQPFGTESLQFSRELLMQQEVRVVVERVDPAGTFLGSLFVGKQPGVSGGTKNEDFAGQLLKRGLAYCDDWCNKDLYYTVQEQAKKEKVNWWSIDHAENCTDAQEQSDEKTAVKGGNVTGELISLTSLQDFCLIHGGKDKVVKQMIVSELKTKVEQKAAEGQLIKKQIYLAIPWGKKDWHRVVWLGRGTEGGKYSVYLVDCGSYSETDEIRKVLAGSTLLTEPAACVRCGLYGVRTSNDVWESACQALFDQCGTKMLNAIIERVDYDRDAPAGVPNTVCRVVLYAGDICLNEQLLKDSWVRLTRREATFSAAARVDYTKWRSIEKVCSTKTRVRLWQHGCPDSDEDEY